MHAFYTVLSVVVSAVFTENDAKILVLVFYQRGQHVFSNQRQFSLAISQRERRSTRFTLRIHTQKGTVQ